MPVLGYALNSNGTPPADQTGEAILRLEGLTKQFGRHRAVHNINLEIRSGEVLGLLGPNGAGKSTLIGMILGLVRPTRGRVVYGGLALSKIGAIIENPAFYPFMSGRDNLRALALLIGNDDRKHIDRLLALVRLDQAAGRKVGVYSLGMKQRLGLASTLLAYPRLIILDEPTNGLDPAGQDEIRHIIPRLAHEGRAVIVASHLLHDVEQVCNRVAIMENGMLRRTGSMSELLSHTRQLEIRVEEPNRALAILLGLNEVDAARAATDGRLLVDADPEAAPLISRVLAENGLYIQSLTTCQASLEDVFFEVTRPDGEN